MANLKAASSLTMTGNLSQSGATYNLNLGIVPGQGCAGTVGEGSKGSFKLIVIGKTLYLNPDNTFWTVNGGAGASAVIALVHGRYIKTSTTGSMGSIASLCDLSRTIGSTGVTGTFTKGAVATRNGTPVLPLNNSSGSVLDVTDTSTPQVVQITDSTSGTLTFVPGAPVTLAAPPASQVIKGSAVGM